MQHKCIHESIALMYHILTCLCVKNAVSRKVHQLVTVKYFDTVADTLKAELLKCWAQLVKLCWTGFCSCTTLCNMVEYVHSFFFHVGMR